MRPRWLPLLASLAFTIPLSAKEAVRTLTASLPPGEAAQVAVENLSGEMRVIPSAGTVVEATATVHARIPELAALVRFERVTGEGGVPTLRVRYPLDLHTSYRYPGIQLDGGLLLGLLPGSPIRSEYEGKRVTISDRRGALLWADVEIRLPSRTTLAKVRTVAGSINARGVTGSLTLETGYGTVILNQIHGDVVADTFSGNVAAQDVSGSLKCDAGHGDCNVTAFSGDALSCVTGEGEVRVTNAAGRSVSVDTGSGHVHLEDVDATDVNVDTGSGNLDLGSPSKRLARLKIVTGSGTVKLRLAHDADFEAHCGLGSGRIQNHFPDADPIVRKRAIVGYRRGDGRIKIDVEMGSGSLLLEPLRVEAPPR